MVKINKLLNEILKVGCTPNQLLILLGIHKKTSYRGFNYADELPILMQKGFIIKNDIGYVITNKGKNVIDHIESLLKYAEAKRVTYDDTFIKYVNDYREIFPKQKLPSGKLARQNVNQLAETFKWFFSQYDFTWEEVLEATKKYVLEYKMTDYLYMQTSQFFIKKQDKHKVVTSALADYCNAVREGLEEDNNFFKENVV